MPAKVCDNCGSADARAKGLCPACYMHRRRHGSDRPEEAAIRVAVRDVERELVAKRLGRGRN